MYIVYCVVLCLHGIHMFLGTKVVPSIVEVISGAQQWSKLLEWAIFAFQTSVSQHSCDHNVHHRRSALTFTAYSSHLHNNICCLAIEYCRRIKQVNGSLLTSTRNRYCSRRIYIHHSNIILPISIRSLLLFSVKYYDNVLIPHEKQLLQYIQLQ